KTVCLVDGDLVQPSQHLYFSLANAPASLSALCRLIEQNRFGDSDFENLTLDLVVPKAKVTLIAGVPNELTAETITLDSFETLLEMLVLKFDEVVIDLATLSEQNQALVDVVLKRADRIIVTSLADPISVHRFINNLETLSRHVDFEKSQLLVNRVNSSILGSNPQQQLEQTLRKHTPFNRISYLPEDPAFEIAMQKSLPLSFASKKTPALETLRLLIE
ncbi:MAG: MinD/ParA family protein, partial [Micrococcales bacterium]